MTSTKFMAMGGAVRSGTMEGIEVAWTGGGGPAKVPCPKGVTGVMKGGRGVGQCPIPTQPTHLVKSRDIDIGDVWPGRMSGCSCKGPKSSHH